MGHKVPSVTSVKSHLNNGDLLVCSLQQVINSDLKISCEIINSFSPLKNLHIVRKSLQLALLTGYLGCYS